MIGERMTIDTELVGGVYIPRKVYKYRCSKCGHIWLQYDGEKACRKCYKSGITRLSEVVGGRVGE